MGVSVSAAGEVEVGAAGLGVQRTVESCLQSRNGAEA